MLDGCLEPDFSGLNFKGGALGTQGTQDFAKIQQGLATSGKNGRSGQWCVGPDSVRPHPSVLQASQPILTLLPSESAPTSPNTPVPWRATGGLHLYLICLSENLHTLHTWTRPLTRLWTRLTGFPPWCSKTFPLLVVLLVSIAAFERQHFLVEVFEWGSQKKIKKQVRAMTWQSLMMGGTCFVISWKIFMTWFYSSFPWHVNWPAKAQIVADP